MANNLMNRFGGQRMQAPLAPMQQQRPGMLEQIGTSAGMAVGTDFAKDQMKEGLGAVKDNIGFMFGPDAATAGMAEAVGSGAATGAGSQAAMLAAQNAGLEGAAGLTAEALGAGTAATEAAALGATEAGLAGGAGAMGGAMGAVGTAMPWVGAGLLAGKALGLFSKGGPVDYKKCGGKMKYRAEGGRADQDDYQDIARLYDLYMSKDTPKYEARPYRLSEPKVYSNELPKMGEKHKMTPLNYRAEGGDVGFFDYLKRSFTEKPAWADNVPVQVPVTDSSGNVVTDSYGNTVTSTVYQRPTTQAKPQPRQPAPVEDHSVNLEKAIARDIYGEYDDGEDMGDASYLAGDPAPYSVQTYPLERRGDIQMKSNTPPKGGPLLRKFGAPGIRRDPQEFNRDLNEYSIKRNNRLNPQPDDGSGIWEDMKGFFKSMGQSNSDDADVSGFNMGGRVGPLKSIKYKAAGGDVVEQSYYGMPSPKPNPIDEEILRGLTLES